MSDSFKPMLAGNASDLGLLKFPIIAQPKLDGIRCLVWNCEVLSRKLKPIPNNYIRETILAGLTSLDLMADLDGEIMLRGEADFNKVQSAVMSEEGEPDFEYIIFDTVAGNNYTSRLEFIRKEVAGPPFKIISSAIINNLEELSKIEEEFITLGYEGVMLRSPEGPYKFGRSTEKEGYLLKLKRFHDSEAKVIGFVEQKHNSNEAEKDALGYTKRSSSKEGKVGSNKLGSLLVSSPEFGGSTFGIGTGFTDAQRQILWDNQCDYLGKTVTFKYQELSIYGIPRFPVFKCFRLD